MQAWPRFWRPNTTDASGLWVIEAVGFCDRDQFIPGKTRKANRDPSRRWLPSRTTRTRGGALNVRCTTSLLHIERDRGEPKG